MHLAWRPERVFLVPFPRMDTDPLRALDLRRLEVAEGFGLLCRCIVGSLMTSRRIRQNTRFTAVFSKPPEIPVEAGEVKAAWKQSLQGKRLPGVPAHLKLDILGNEVRMIYAEEVWVAATFRKACQRFSDAALGSTWANSARTAGWRLQACESFWHELEELNSNESAGGEVVMLLHDKEGQPAEEVLEALKSCNLSRLVILPHTAEMNADQRANLCKEFPLRRVRLGSEQLAPPQRIVVLNYLIDRIWPPVSSTDSAESAQNSTKLAEKRSKA
eukprot:s503_g2.t1